MTSLHNTGHIETEGFDDIQPTLTPESQRSEVKTAVVQRVRIDVGAAGYSLAPLGTQIPELQKMIHAWAISKGWRGPEAETQRTTGDDIALIVSEASEALEAFRDSHNPNAVWYTYTVEVEGIKFPNLSVEQVKVLLQLETLDETFAAIEELSLCPKPEGVGPELADLVIRVLDYCEEHGLDLLHFLIEKMNHNDTRPWQHGGKHL